MSPENATSYIQSLLCVCQCSDFPVFSMLIGLHLLLSIGICVLSNALHCARKWKLTRNLSFAVSHRSLPLVVVYGTWQWSNLIRSLKLGILIPLIWYGIYRKVSWRKHLAVVVVVIVWHIALHFPSTMHWIGGLGGSETGLTITPNQEVVFCVHDGIAMWSCVSARCNSAVARAGSTKKSCSCSCCSSPCQGPSGSRKVPVPLVHSTWSRNQWCTGYK